MRRWFWFDSEMENLIIFTDLILMDCIGGIVNEQGTQKTKK